jgi:predicted DNA-binding transcriptional regulator AlpA
MVNGKHGQMTAPQVSHATPWLTIEQLADRWQTTVQAVYKLRHTGKTPRAAKWGRSLRWHIDDVTEWENAQREGGS